MKKTILLLCKTGGLGIERNEHLIIVDTTREEDLQYTLKRKGNEGVKFIIRAEEVDHEPLVSSS